MSILDEGYPDNVRRMFPDQVRYEALEVMGNTDTWTGSDWERAATSLASAVVAACGDLDRLPPVGLPKDAAWKPYLGPLSETPEHA